MIRKLVVVSAVIAVVAAMAPASTAEESVVRRTRSLALDYECPCGARAWGSGLGVYWGFGGTQFLPKENERYLHMSIEDDVAQSVAAKVGIDTDPGNFEYEYDYSVCGATEEPLEVQPGYEVHIYIYWGTCDDLTTQSFPTAGTVNVTLSNVP